MDLALRDRNHMCVVMTCRHDDTILGLFRSVGVQTEQRVDSIGHRGDLI